MEVEFNFYFIWLFFIFLLFFFFLWMKNIFTSFRFRTENYIRNSSNNMTWWFFIREKGINLLNDETFCSKFIWMQFLYAIEKLKRKGWMVRDFFGYSFQEYLAWLWIWEVLSKSTPSWFHFCSRWSKIKDMTTNFW